MKEMENWDFQISTNQYPVLENFSQFTKEIEFYKFSYLFLCIQEK